MNFFTVSFLGHRDFSEHHLYEENLVNIIKDLIRSKEYIDFLVGRNRELVDRADLIICYIKRKNGGAYEAVKYAIKKGKNVINLAGYSLLKASP